MPTSQLYKHPYLRNLPEAELKSLAERCHQWGMHPTDFASQVSNWFYNFDDETDWPLALKLLKALEYHPEAGFHALLKQRQEAVFRHLLRRGLSVERIWFAVPDDLADSATRHAHPLSKVWQLPNERFISFASIARQNTLGAQDTLILFNDTYGSGQQFMREVWPHVVPLVDKLGAVLIVGAAMAQAALERFRQEASGAEIIPRFAEPTVKNLNGFSAQDVARLEELGQHVYPKHPLGFGGCGLLLAYHFQCPNNSLPLIWADGSNNAVVGKTPFPWKPLFAYRGKTQASAAMQAATPAIPPANSVVNSAISANSATPVAPVAVPPPVPQPVVVAAAHFPPPTAPRRAGLVAIMPTVSVPATAQPVWASDSGEDDIGQWVEFTVNGIIQRLRLIPAGRFLMGAPEKEDNRSSNEGPQHWVNISHSFWLADTTCTQALWQCVMDQNPSHFNEKNRGGPKHPVEQVSWHDAQVFLQKLNRFLPGCRVTLPTEAEWEYACRAGSSTPFHFGGVLLTDQANFNGNHPYGGGPKGAYRERTLPVTALPQNRWGLYQMHGNVWEWCADWLRTYTAAEVTDPGINEVWEAENGDIEAARALRGGCWFGSALLARSAYRFRSAPGGQGLITGFRLALRSSPAGK